MVKDVEVRKGKIAGIHSPGHIEFKADEFNIVDATNKLLLPG